MLPPENLVVELTQLVWSTMLGLEAEGAEARGPGALEVATAVDITGAWQGTVSVACPSALARRLASALDGGRAHDTEGEIADALAEIVSVIGGNLKATLPGPSELSAPRRASASDAASTGGRTQWFSCEGSVFGVTVNEGERSAAT